MEKECFDSWDFFCMMHSFRVCLKTPKILVFIKNASQVAIL